MAMVLISSVAVTQVGRINEAAVGFELTIQ